MIATTPFVLSVVEARSHYGREASFDYGQRPQFILSACLAGSRRAQDERILTGVEV